MGSVSSINSLVNSASNDTSTQSSSDGVDLSSILSATSGNTAAIDVTAAVAAAIYADRAPERSWQAEQTTLSSQTITLQAIQTATNAVSTDLQSLNSLTGPLAERTVNSSGANVTATAANGTAAGTHSVVVNSLASTASWYSDVVSSATATLPDSSVTITSSSGTTKTIATGSGQTGDTLNDLVTAINGDNLGVTASIVSDATGSRLALIANASGAAANFSVTSPDYTGTSWTSSPIPTGDSLGANTFTLKVGGTTTNITTTAGETYAQLASDINGKHLGVTATASSNAKGTTLQITSDDSTPFTISEPSFGFTQAAAGQDANISVDGVPVDSASNTVTGAIPGVTLSLLGASATPASLTVASNSTDVAKAINQFVTDYNTAIGLVNQQFTLDSTGAEGVLSADTTIANLQSTLEGGLNYLSPTSAGSTSTIRSLYDLGITENSDGTLSVDSSTLASAITNKAADVQSFFAGSTLNGFANAFSTSLDTFSNPATGAFTVDLSGISTTNTDLTNQINDFESNYIANQQTLLTAKFSKAEEALQSLPTQLKQIQAELGNNGSGNNG